jgi:hypothetical protein
LNWLLFGLFLQSLRQSFCIITIIMIYSVLTLYFNLKKYKITRCGRLICSIWSLQFTPAVFSLFWGFMWILCCKFVIPRNPKETSRNTSRESEEMSKFQGYVLIHLIHLMLNYSRYYYLVWQIWDEGYDTVDHLLWPYPGYLLK